MWTRVLRPLPRGDSHSHSLLLASCRKCVNGSSFARVTKCCLAVPLYRLFSTKTPKSKSPATTTTTTASTASTASSSVTFTQTRQADFEKLRQQSPQWTPYPSHFATTTTIQDIITRYSSLEVGARVTDQPLRITGRITSKREASSKLIFYHIETGQQTIQLLCSRATYSADADFTINRIIKRGDIIGVEGFPGKSNTGELSIIPTQLHILSPCMHEIPLKLAEPNLRYRQRYLDFLVNRSNLTVFRTRARIIASLRSYLNNHGFIEVETPNLWTTHGGAAARPFITNSNAFGTDLPLYLRIAPELFLKELIIGGLERVYEIGKVFRNEGIDATHNPEFTSCEFYQAHADYRTLMGFTEQLLRHLVQDALGRLTVTAHSYHNPDQTHEIDFTHPFRTLDIMSTLSSKLGCELPNPNDETNLSFYMKQCTKYQLSLNQPITLPQCLDKLIGHFIEPECIQPTFLLHHPECMSPLAKSLDDRPGLTQRFELFINGKEYCNSYTELNDPSEQRRRMTIQAQAHASGDVEAQPVDTHFCTALEYGLPPTAGWGLGIDRFVMLLAQTHHIRDVLLFPIMKPSSEDS